MEYTNMTDGWTDRQTPHDGIGRACIASRSKKETVFDVKNLGLLYLMMKNV